MRNYLLGWALLTLAGMSFAANNTEHATTASSANAAIGPESAQKANSSDGEGQDSSDKSGKDESFWTFLKGTQPDNAVYLVF